MLKDGEAKYIKVGLYGMTLFLYSLIFETISFCIFFMKSIILYSLCFVHHILCRTSHADPHKQLKNIKTKAQTEQSKSLYTVRIVRQNAFLRES